LGQPLAKYSRTPIVVYVAHVHDLVFGRHDVGEYTIESSTTSDRPATRIVLFEELARVPPIHPQMRIYAKLLRYRPGVAIQIGKGPRAGLFGLLADAPDVDPLALPLEVRPCRLLVHASEAAEQSGEQARGARAR